MPYSCQQRWHNAQKKSALYTEPSTPSPENAMPFFESTHDYVNPSSSNSDLPISLAYKQHPNSPSEYLFSPKPPQRKWRFQQSSLSVVALGSKEVIIWYVGIAHGAVTARTIKTKFSPSNPQPDRRNFTLSTKGSFGDTTMYKRSACQDCP